MKTSFQTRQARISANFHPLKKFFYGVAVMLGAATTVFGQGEVASGSLISSGSGPYTYNLTFTDSMSATQPIGSIWFGWTPSGFFLPGMPTGASAPSGWSAAVDFDSVRYTANSTSDYIAAGSSLSGFGFNASFTPAQYSGNPNSGLSVAYKTSTIEGDAGNTFNVAAVAPEPATWGLLCLGGIALFALNKRRFGNA